jgi:hypothetical protein
MSIHLNSPIIQFFLQYFIVMQSFRTIILNNFSQHFLTVIQFKSVILIIIRFKDSARVE